MYNTNIKYLYQLLLDLYRRFYGFYVIWFEPSVKAKNYLYFGRCLLFIENNYHSFTQRV